jgi:hypothetical protein
VTIDLAPYRAVEIGNLVRITPPAPAAALAFSDMNRSVTVGGITYGTLGLLLNVSDYYSELRAVEQEVTVSLAGIPTSNVTTFLATPYKGSTIQIQRVYFDPVTLSEIGSGINRTKFLGRIKAYNLEESWDSEARTATFTITLQCNSDVSTLDRSITGRRTSDDDQQRLYPGDLSFSRVATITQASFQFGKPVAGSNQ